MKIICQLLIFESRLYKPKFAQKCLRSLMVITEWKKRFVKELHLLIHIAFREGEEPSLILKGGQWTCP
uniref:Uncharacterized protein n=1 Tax=Anaerobacillus isosaccharinicus TaxID=1532552 RepID=A0A1S2LS57_9BACI